ncbi:MAG: hypothetical protein ACT4OK_22840 [Gemmobacter sp.]
MGGVHAVTSEQPGRPVWFIHGARDRQSHAFKAEVDRLVATHPGFQRRVFCSAPRKIDVQGPHSGTSGRITAQDLLALGAGTHAHCMLCGPVPFLADIRAGLESAGVPQEVIHVETFGPTG